jgi:pyruvate-ferredoxin/flavodoxin oxidoreductase
MGVRINTIMQTCFFAISEVLPREEAIEQIKKFIKKTYGKKGDAVVQKNFQAVDTTLVHLHQVAVPGTVTATRTRPATVASEAPEFVRKVTALMMAGKGDQVPVSGFNADGTWPVATTQWEKRNIALDIPVWDDALCIQCNKCAFMCPHAAIRPKVYDPALLAGAPATFKSTDAKGAELKGLKYTLQVGPEDCTGCGICVAVCPTKDKANPERKAITLAPQPPLRAAERDNYAFFLGLPDPDRAALKADVKGSQFMRPLFEYSGCCAGCGETPYVKLVTQLFGDRALIANATGCSSVYGGNLPTTPYCVNAQGLGPAWNNSLFEDNAEFGFGMRLAVDKQKALAEELVRRLAGQLGDQRVKALLEADQSTETGIQAQRGRVAELRQALAGIPGPDAKLLTTVADLLVKRSVWIIGGDGWAYDIGYGGLDHVLAQGRNVNLLVLDTEVYSNTGGQASKATPMGAAARFAVSGKSMPKKDLGMIAMAYGNIYVARVAAGAKDAQTVKAFLEAESYDGPSIIIAYCHCIAHGFDLVKGCDQQKLAVDTGYWPLYRFDPRRIAKGEAPLILDSPAPKVPLAEYVKNETRYRMVQQAFPERFKELMAAAQVEVDHRYQAHANLAKLVYPAQP